MATRRKLVETLADHLNTVLSAKKAKYAKGDRIIVSRGGEYFAATVTSCGGGGKLVYFKFDNGDKDSLSTRSKFILGRTKRMAQCINPIGEAELTAWLEV